MLSVWLTLTDEGIKVGDFPLKPTTKSITIVRLYTNMRTGKLRVGYIDGLYEEMMLEVTAKKNKICHQIKNMTVKRPNNPKWVIKASRTTLTKIKIYIDIIEHDD